MRGIFPATWRAGCACAISLGLVAASGAQPPQESELTTAGRRALAEKNYELAGTLFERAYAAATDAEAAARLVFFQAVVADQQVQEAVGPESRALLEKAAELYVRYLEAKPRSSAANNNLARVYERLGGNEEVVERLYEKAIDLDAERRPLYRVNYARFLDAGGRPEEADRIYDELAREQPLMASYHQRVLRRYLERGAWDALDAYLWKLRQARQSRRALDGALEVLERVKRDEVAGGLKESLMALVCMSLNDQPTEVVEQEPANEPGDFAQTEFDSRLRALGDNTDVGRGALQLLTLQEGRTLQRREYSWWAERGSIREDAPRGVWPVDGFRARARALGRLALDHGDLEMAERYQRFAIDLIDREIDPAAMRELFYVYLKRTDAGGFDALQPLLEEFESRLFESKGQAYEADVPKKIFEFHRTLGELYGLIGRWGDSGTIDSAIFQLEHAQRTSERLEEELGAEGARDYRFGSGLTNLLATAYFETGRVDQSYELRLSQARRYAREDDALAAAEVLQPIRSAPPPDTTSPRIREEYESLLETKGLWEPLRRIERKENQPR